MNLSRLTASSEKTRYPDIERDGRERSRRPDGLAVHVRVFGQLANRKAFHYI
jgi:hypothetical protein